MGCVILHRCMARQMGCVVISSTISNFVSPWFKSKNYPCGAATCTDVGQQIGGDGGSELKSSSVLRFAEAQYLH